jgi:hypothetical protein
VRAKSLTTVYRSEPVASLSVKFLAMTAKTDRRWRPHIHTAAEPAYELCGVKINLWGQRSSYEQIYLVF